MVELLRVGALREAYRSGAARPTDVVEEVFRRLDASADQAVWTCCVPRQQVRARAAELAGRRGELERLPLYGVPFGVKDNLDVRDLPTRCGCPSYDREPERHAAAVQRALDAGAILVGKQALDQFATGLNGTRTIGAHPRNVFDEAIIPGGSSSGSAVAVAAGLVAFSLGSDTGGSGRVPAAMNNIVGVRPSVGLVSSRGLVFNNRSFDCVPVFAPTVGDAFDVLAAIAGHDDEDPWSRADAPSVLAGGPFPERFTFGVPDAQDFFADAESARLFQAAVERLRQLGGTPRAISLSALREAGRLVFGSALVAERAANYGEVLESSASDLVPAVASVLQEGFRHSAVDAFRAMYRLQELRVQFERAMVGLDLLLTPTVPRPYTVAEMLAEPLARNNEVGYYTYGVGPLGLCAIAVPAAIRCDGVPFGVSLVGCAGADGRLASLARRFEAATALRPGAEARAQPAGERKTT